MRDAGEADPGKEGSEEGMDADFVSGRGGEKSAGDHHTQ